MNRVSLVGSVCWSRSAAGCPPCHRGGSTGRFRASGAADPGALCVNCHGPQKRRGGLAPGHARAGLQGRRLRRGRSQARRPGRERAPEAHHHPRKVRANAAARRSPARSEVALLRRWIGEGARWPDSANVAAPTRQHGPLVITDADRAHWAFRPLGRHELPAVQDEKWCRTPSTASSWPDWRPQEIKPNAAADRRRLIRRVYFDLIGLPPTPEEIDAFVDDPSPDAYEKLIDRLLASPHYGERWGRHWLDLARYADSRRLRARLRPADRLSLPRFRHPGAQRRPAVSTPSSSGSWPATSIAPTTPPAADGDRLPPAGRRVCTSPRSARNWSGRATATTSWTTCWHHRRRLARPDGRLRPLPRPQVRPRFRPGRLLPDAGRVHHQQAPGSNTLVPPASSPSTQQRFTGWRQATRGGAEEPATGSLREKASTAGRDDSRNGASPARCRGQGPRWQHLPTRQTSASKSCSKEHGKHGS